MITEITEEKGIERWLLMWAIATSIFAAAKWLTCRDALRHRPASRGRILGYLFLWPGMDAAAFLYPSNPIPPPAAREYLAPTLRMSFGAALIWLGVRTVNAGHPLLSGWLGMLGLICLLHFGSFHLLALLWRRAGVPAEPIMRSPSRSASLAEFWGVRWNRGFHDLVRRHLFLPLRPKLGAPGATLATFFASGVLHELVISIPAGGGYGLPTAYFLLQGAGVLVQRSAWGARCGLRRGWRARFFTLAVTAGPVFWLFHPLFVRRVILPFLTALHPL